MVRISSILQPRNAQLLLNQPGTPYDEGKAHTMYKSGVSAQIAIRASAADRARQVRSYNHTRSDVSDSNVSSKAARQQSRTGLD
jgi:hypothetical protein